MNDELFDCVIVGAGMAGVSLGCELSVDRSVLILEAEAQPAYHATGRSAAFYTELFGNEVVRALTSASRDFLVQPPDGFSAQALLTPRGALYLAGAGQEAAAQSFYDESIERVPDLMLETAAFAQARVPILRDGFVSCCVFEPDAQQIDVDGLLQGYLRRLRANGGKLQTGAGVRSAEFSQGRWLVHTSAGEVQGKMLINAAGAWADSVAASVGARGAGLQPMRRTVCIIDAPDEYETDGWPAVTDIDHSFYFVPDVGRLLLSPADETPLPACDVYPEDIDVATAVDRFEAVTRLSVKRVVQQWAGLRTFAPDRTPIVGSDPHVPGFFWFAGQGGYGIQMAPALARCGAALVRGTGIPADVTASGVHVDSLSRGRL